ncbi:MAG: hypothetical protein JNK15_03805 [Planctomycetes bacterium]|nr:hypothetical protein [Planctomycetota bacterium]
MTSLLVPAFAFAALFAVAAPAQDPLAGGRATEGFGRGPTYRQALAEALADAVGKAKGIAVQRSGALQSRLRIVSEWGQGLPEGSFDGVAEREREWVGQQLAGFVRSYDVAKRGKADDGEWEVTVQARIAALADAESFVVDLSDDDLRAWELERFEDGAAAPFARAEGRYEAPTIRDNLRATGVVHVVAKTGGVELGEGVAAREREKAGHRLVASHAVTVAWQPMRLRSVVEKPNRARPTNGPRPQFLTGASVQVSVRVVDRVRDVEVFERRLTVALDVPEATPVERLDAIAVQLGDRAKAEVAATIFFALQPPVVLRKWPGEGGKDWFVEVAMARRVAAGYDSFEVGLPGSLANPDWRSLGRAVLVGGDATTCTFRLDGVDDPAKVDVGTGEVRPARK